MSVRTTPAHDAGRRLDATSTTSSGGLLVRSRLRQSERRRSSGQLATCRGLVAQAWLGTSRPFWLTTRTKRHSGGQPRPFGRTISTRPTPALSSRTRPSASTTVIETSTLSRPFGIGTITATWLESVSCSLHLPSTHARTVTGRSISPLKLGSARSTPSTHPAAVHSVVASEHPLITATAAPHTHSSRIRLTALIPNWCPLGLRTMRRARRPRRPGRYGVAPDVRRLHEDCFAARCARH